MEFQPTEVASTCECLTSGEFCITERKDVDHNKPVSYYRLTVLNRVFISKHYEKDLPAVIMYVLQLSDYLLYLRLGPANIPTPRG